MELAREGKFTAFYERSSIAAGIQGTSYFEFTTDQPQAIISTANTLDFRHSIARFTDVILLNPQFLPVLINERLALFEYIVNGPAGVVQDAGFRYAASSLEVDFSHIGMTVEEPCVLLGGWGVWYHWLMNFLPRAYTIELALPVMPDLPSRKVVVANDVLSKPGFMSSLSAMGMGRDRIVDLAGHTVVYFKDLVIPNIFPNSMHFGAAINFISERIRRYYLGDNYLTTREFRRTYISRDGGAPFTRRVVNHLEIDAIFLRYGFDIVRMEDLSLGKQVEIMHNSSIIVGPHGSGLTNMIFANPGTRFMEIGGFERSMFSDLAELLGIEATTLLLPLGSYVELSATDAHWVDYKIDPSLLVAALERLDMDKISADAK